MQNGKQNAKINGCEPHSLSVPILSGCDSNFNELCDTGSPHTTLQFALAGSIYAGDAVHL